MGKDNRLQKAHTLSRNTDEKIMTQRIWKTKKKQINNKRKWNDREKLRKNFLEQTDRSCSMKRTTWENRKRGIFYCFPPKNHEPLLIETKGTIELNEPNFLRPKVFKSEGLWTTKAVRKNSKLSTACIYAAITDFNFTSLSGTSKPNQKTSKETQKNTTRFLA